MVKKPRIEFEIFDLAVYPHDVKTKGKTMPEQASGNKDGPRL